MTDHLARAEASIANSDHQAFDSASEKAYLSDARSAAAVSSATDLRRLADGIERIATHLTLPQGAVDTGQTTGFVAPAPSPAEPSLVALDLADEVIGELRRWREADRIFPCESTEWWDATLRLRDVADRIGGAL